MLRRSPLALLLVTLTALAGCNGSGGERPATLFDGTVALEAPVALDGARSRTVLTKVRALLDGTSDERTRSCLEEHAGLRPEAASVVRVGVASESVTLLEESGRAVFGCDNGAGERDADKRWCGASFGSFSGGRLQDPRLDILCTTEEGRSIGLVWIDPVPRARYVAVEQPGYLEVYETAGDLPVRVATITGVDLERSSADFAISEHDAMGALLRRYELTAVVAG